MLPSLRDTSSGTLELGGSLSQEEEGEEAEVDDGHDRSNPLSSPLLQGPQAAVSDPCDANARYCHLPLAEVHALHIKLP